MARKDLQLFSSAHVTIRAPSESFRFSSEEDKAAMPAFTWKLHRASTPSVAHNLANCPNPRAMRNGEFSEFVVKVRAMAEQLLCTL